MREVILAIPTIEPNQNLEIDVKISGSNKSLKYRVEIVQCKNPQKKTECITVLKHAVKEKDKNWQLIQIGAPEDGNVPLMFKMKDIEE